MQIRNRFKFFVTLTKQRRNIKVTRTQINPNPLVHLFLQATFLRREHHPAAVQQEEDHTPTYPETCTTPSELLHCYYYCWQRARFQRQSSRLQRRRRVFGTSVSRSSRRWLYKDATRTYFYKKNHSFSLLCVVVFVDLEGRKEGRKVLAVLCVTKRNRQVFPRYLQGNQHLLFLSCVGCVFDLNMQSSGSLFGCYDGQQLKEVAKKTKIIATKNHWKVIRFWRLSW